MPISAEQIKLLNTATPGLYRAKLGDIIGDLSSAPTATKAGAVTSGAHVPNAAGANPTKAEFDALLVSLRATGVLRAS